MLAALKERQEELKKRFLLGWKLYLYEPSLPLRDHECGPRKDPLLEELLSLNNGTGLEYVGSSQWDPPPRFQVRIFPSYQRRFPHLEASFRPDKNRNTIHRMMRRWLRNYSIHASSGPARYIRIPDHTSFVFAGASPSLNEELESPVLHRNRQKYILISSDTALPAVLRTGLNPDLVLSVDASPATSYHFLESFRIMESRSANLAEMRTAEAEQNGEAVAREEDRDGKGTAQWQGLPGVLLTYSAGPAFLYDFYSRVVFYESDFPPELRASWMGISNPLGNVAGLAISLVASGRGNDLLLLGSDGKNRPRSHCRSTGYDYFAQIQQNRLNSPETYFSRPSSPGRNYRSASSATGKGNPDWSAMKLEHPGEIQSSQYQDSGSSAELRSELQMQQWRLAHSMGLTLRYFEELPVWEKALQGGTPFLDWQNRVLELPPLQPGAPYWPETRTSPPFLYIADRA